MFPSRYFSPFDTTGVSGPTPLRTRADTVRAVMPGPPSFGAKLPSGFWAPVRYVTALSMTGLRSAAVRAAPARPSARAAGLTAARRSQSRRVSMEEPPGETGHPAGYAGTAEVAR